MNLTPYSAEPNRRLLALLAAVGCFALCGIVTWHAFDVVAAADSETMAFEAGLWVFLVLGILGFPVAMLASISCRMAVAALFPELVFDAQADALLIGVASAFGGYIQWFVLIPWSVRMIRKRI